MIRATLCECVLKERQQPRIVQDGRIGYIDVPVELSRTSEQAVRIGQSSSAKNAEIHIPQPLRHDHRHIPRHQTPRSVPPWAKKRARAVELYRKEYGDFGPTLATEYLAERPSRWFLSRASPASCPPSPPGGCLVEGLKLWGHNHALKDRRHRRSPVLKGTRREHDLLVASPFQEEIICGSFTAAAAVASGVTSGRSKPGSSWPRSVSRRRLHPPVLPGQLRLA